MSRQPAAALTWSTLLLLAVAALAALSVGCVNIDELRADAEFFASANRKLAVAAVSSEAKGIATTNADAWEVQAWELGGRKPHESVLQRIGVAPVDSAQ